MHAGGSFASTRAGSPGRPEEASLHRHREHSHVELVEADVPQVCAAWLGVSNVPWPTGTPGHMRWIWNEPVGAERMAEAQELPAAKCTLHSPS